jgi:Uma2 family endonuclease
MERKVGDYFAWGCRLVWLVDPGSRTVTVYTSPDDSIVFTRKQTLTGGEVLPGFKLRLQDLFAVLDEGD